MAKRGNLEESLKELDGLKSRGIITEEEYQQRRVALLTAAPSTGAPTKRGGGFMRTAGIGCGVLVLAAVVLVAIAVAVGGGNDDESVETTAGSGQGSSNRSDVRVPLAVGSSGIIAPQGNNDKRQKVTILAIQDGAQPANQFSQPPAGKKYYAIQVEIENVGTAEVTSLDWKFRDTKDTELSRDFVAGLGESLQQPPNMTPGAKTSGWLVFTIDADAGPKWLRADPNPFLRNDLYFDAQ